MKGGYPATRSRTSLGHVEVGVDRVHVVVLEGVHQPQERRGLYSPTSTVLLGSIESSADSISTPEPSSAERTAPRSAVVTDVGMVAAGITGRHTRCFVSDPRASELSERLGITRSAAGFRLAADEVGPEAVWIVGNAPTALFELLELDLAPTLVIGLPVGFVGAAESKDALVASGLPAVTNRGPKGGSAVAAAALNALIYHEEEST